MLILKTRPAANGRRNMKARLEPFSRSLCRKRGLRRAGAHGHHGAHVDRVCACKCMRYMGARAGRQLSTGLKELLALCPHRTRSGERIRGPDEREPWAHGTCLAYCSQVPPQFLII